MLDHTSVKEKEKALAEAVAVSSVPCLSMNRADINYAKCLSETAVSVAGVRQTALSG